ncbi:MAG: sulfur oxidation c-type cytochrome SoxA [Thiohalorhabdus sp.]|uniref:sulfur oxidation c-type cytochrome SoxA n=1 Tax=Thiohalorhabdus sp. TaxID=3094134 RepID=UPI00397EB4A1
MQGTAKKLYSYGKWLLGLPAALLLGGVAQAQCLECTNEPPQEILEMLIEETGSDYLTQSQQNLQLMPDNPAYFVAEDGKDLFHEKRGPNNASLEKCDFGKGPGELEGAVAELPRYFEDTGKVMTLETRLVHCMKTIQGFSEDDPEIAERHGSDSVMMQLQTYIASKSNGYEWGPPMDHPMEKAMRDAGEKLFYRRAGPMDFSCNSCHGETGKRIRASVLPNMNEPKEWTKSISWPARRVGHQEVRSNYHRLRGCYWQMRQGLVEPDSDAAVAVMTFWNDAARGEPAILPDLKR